MDNPFADMGLMPLECRGFVCLHRRTEECERELIEDLWKRPGVRSVFPVSVFPANNWKPDAMHFWAVRICTDNREDWGRTYSIPVLLRWRDMGRLKNVRPYDPEFFRRFLDPDHPIF